MRIDDSLYWYVDRNIGDKFCINIDGRLDSDVGYEVLNGDVEGVEI